MRNGEVKRGSHRSVPLPSCASGRKHLNPREYRALRCFLRSKSADSTRERRCICCNGRPDGKSGQQKPGETAGVSEDRVGCSSVAVEREREASELQRVQQRSVTAWDDISRDERGRRFKRRPLSFSPAIYRSAGGTIAVALRNSTFSITSAGSESVFRYAIRSPP